MIRYDLLLAAVKAEHPQAEGDELEQLVADLEAEAIELGMEELDALRMEQLSPRVR